MKKNTPQTVQSFDDICNLKRDNVDLKGCWATLNGPTEISIVRQKSGEAPTETVHLSRRELNVIINWYLHG